MPVWVCLGRLVRPSGGHLLRVGFELLFDSFLDYFLATFGGHFGVTFGAKMISKSGTLFCKVPAGP